MKAKKKTVRLDPRVQAGGLALDKLVAMEPRLRDLAAASERGAQLLRTLADEVAMRLASCRHMVKDCEP